MVMATPGKQTFFDMREEPNQALDRRTMEKYRPEVYLGGHERPTALRSTQIPSLPLSSAARLCLVHVSQIHMWTLKDKVVGYNSTRNYSSASTIWHPVGVQER